MSKTNTMKSVGGWSIALGIIALVAGVSVGVGCIVGGGRLIGSAYRE